MGIKCQIIRDSSNELINVEAPNGQTSNLFRDLLKITGSERKALDLWAYSYSDEFNNIEGNKSKDVNGEFRASTVLKNLELSNAENMVMSPEDSVMILKSVGSLPFNSIEQVFKAFHSSFFNKGVFVVDEKKLLKSGLYTSGEIARIKTDSALRNKIKSTILKMESAFMKGQDLTTINELLNSKPMGELATFTGEMGPLGKPIRSNPYEVENELAPKLAGIKDRNTFQAELSAFPNQQVVLQSINDPEFMEKQFNKFSKMMKIPVAELVNGEIVTVKSNDTLRVLRNTLITGQSNLDLASDIEFLLGIEKSTWEVRPESVVKILKSIEASAADLGIDVIGLHKLYDTKTYESIIEFLSDLNGFSAELYQEVANLDSLKQFAESYDSMFDVTPVEKEVVVSESNSNLVYVNSPLSEIDMFRDYGLVKAGEGLYQLVEKEENVIDTLFDMVQEDPSILPKYAYYPSAFRSDGTFVKSKVTQLDNAENIKRDIKIFLTKKTNSILVSDKDSINDALQIVAFKYIYKHPLTSENNINIDTTFKSFEDFNGDTEYLTGKFISDFNILKTKEKLKNSFIYNNVLRHFEIGDNGLSLINTDPITKKVIQFSTPKNGIFNHLRNYSFISKDPEINSLFPSGTSTSNLSAPFLRNLFSNTPKLLKRYSGKLEVIDNVVNIDNLLDNFIRVGDIVLEKVGETMNTSHYVPVRGISDPLFNIINKNMDSSLVLPTSNSLARTMVGKGGFSQKNIYSKSEVENIRESLDGCN